MCLQAAIPQSRRTVKFSAPVECKPKLALEYLNHLMCQRPCFNSLMQHNRFHLRRVTDCLKNITVSFTFCSDSKS